jgi:hypothetical protein
MELEYNDYVKNLRDDDILEQTEKLFKVGKVKSSLQSAFDNTIPNSLTRHLNDNQVQLSVQEKSTDWFTQGVDCQILKAGSDGWKKGKLKLKVTIEFIPDEPEILEYQSPLDEIRREMQQNS